MQKNFTIFDVETTGLNPKEEKIIQISAVKFGVEEDLLLPTSSVVYINKFETLINPEREIPPFITNLTGIDNEKVKDSQTEEEAIKKFLGFAEDSIVVAHNAPFDLGFVHHATLRAGLEPIVPDFYCTRTIAAVLLPGISHKLVDLVQLFDIELTNAHNATYDTTATVTLFTKLNVISKQYNINFLNKLIHHPDRDMMFKPDNSIIIPLQKGRG